MSVTTTTSLLQTTGDGSTTSFLCAFPLVNPKDVEVYVDSTLQSLTTDYSLSGQTLSRVNTVSSGFNVVFATAPAADAAITVKRKTPLENQSKLFATDEFSLKVFEKAYDTVVMAAQEIKETLGRTYSTDIGEVDAPGQFPVPLKRVGVTAVVTSSDGSGSYELSSVAPDTSGGQDGYQTGSGGSLSFSGAEINGRTDVPVGTTVLAVAIEDSTGGTGWRFLAGAVCGSTPTLGYEFQPIDRSLPSFVVSGDTYVYPSQVATVGAADFPITSTVDGVTMVRLSDYLNYIATPAFIAQLTDSDVTEPYTSVVLDDRSVYYYTGVNPRTQSSNPDWRGTCWTWRRVLKPVTAVYTDAMPNDLNPTSPYIESNTNLGPQYLFHDSNAETGFSLTGSQTSLSPFYISRLECMDEKIYKQKATSSTPDPNPDPPVDCEQTPDDPECVGGDEGPDPLTDIWVRYRNCSDGELADLWRPERLAGQGTGIDFTQAIKISSTTYEASNIKADTPGTVADESAITDSQPTCEDFTTSASCAISSTEFTRLRVKDITAPANATGTNLPSTSGLEIYRKSTWEADFPGSPTEYSVSSFEMVRSGSACDWTALADWRNGASIFDYGSSAGWIMDSYTYGPTLSIVTSPTEGDPRWVVIIPMYFKTVGSSRGMSFVKIGGTTPCGTYYAETQESGASNENGWISSGSLVVEAYEGSTGTTLCTATTGVNANGDVFIARGDNDATATTKFVNGINAGQDIFFDLDGVWNLSLEANLDSDNDGSKISWYDSGSGTNRPIIRSEAGNLDPAIKLTLTGVVDGFEICGIEFDGRTDGSTIFTNGGTEESRPLIQITRGGSYGDNVDTATIDNLVISDIYCHHADTFIEFKDDLAESWYSETGDSRHGGVGMVKGGIVQYCRFAYSTAASDFNRAIVYSGIRSDADLEIRDCLFYKIGFASERYTTPSVSQSSDATSTSNYDPKATEHAIYGRDSGMAAAFVHDNVFSDCAGAAGQFRSGVYFDNNVLLRTPEMAVIGHRGRAVNNTMIDAPNISPEQTPGTVLYGYNLSGPIEVSGNFIAKPDNAADDMAILFSGAETNVLNNVVSGYVGVDQGCADDIVIYWNNCETSYAATYEGLNGNAVYTGTEAASIHSSIPTTYSRSWVETNLLGRAFGTFTIGTHNSETLRQAINAAKP